MKRQERLAASSSHRETATEKQKIKTKAVGCMSGLFHFVSSYHSKHKFLTFGNNKQEKKRKLCSNASEVKRQNVKRLSSCDVPRSPTLPAEIRHHNHSRRSGGPPAVVARLMGLDLEEEYSPAKQLRPQEKRLELLEALEKCDRDLNDLKKIIDAIQSSPDRTTYQCYKRHSFGNGKSQPQFQIQKHNKIVGEENFFTGQNIFDRITYESLQRKPVTNHDTISSHNHVQRIERAGVILSTSTPPKSPSKRGNKAMKDSIEEVSRDIAWGQKREIGRIGLALQDHIFRDLIEEVVTDCSSSHYSISHVNSLPFEACKRRLCF